MPNRENASKPLRLWPGVATAIVMCVMRFVVPSIVPEAMIAGILSTVVGALLIVLWWSFFSRAAWRERLLAVVVMAVAVVGTKPLVHPSIAGAGQGRLLPFMAVPVMTLALVAWAVATRRVSGGLLRSASMVAALLSGCGLFTLVRTGGVTSGLLGFDVHWRWTPTPEDRLLARAREERALPPPPTTEPAKAATPKDAPVPKAPAEKPAAPVATPTTAAEATPAPVLQTAAEWPGFRGPNRDSVIRGVRIETDWAKSPPVALWRRPIGPGWSSFAVKGDLLYTQEQRGDDEIVACYKVSSGEPVWRHKDAVRFWESNGGAGPRATPTLSGGRAYAFGATGILNALDAASGKVLWSRNAPKDTKRETPIWGFTSSPLVVGDVVIVAVSGTLAGYDAVTGTPRWVGPQHGGTYSSPQLATIDGVTQVLLLSPPGITSVAPADGTLLWEHTWDGGAITQPALTADGGVLINAIASTGGIGTRRLAVARGSSGWKVEERWTSNGLKPYFNDFVLHHGHAFGFDGSILACINLEDGKRKWKGGRYGNGQLVLLADQDLLLVLSEEGELALVSATTEAYKELARFPALNGKTWNHPVLIGDLLLVRNGEEMAAFRLALAGR